MGRGADGEPTQEVTTAIQAILGNQEGTGVGAQVALVAKIWDPFNTFLISQNRQMPVRLDLGEGHWPTGTMPLISLVLEPKPC